MSEELNQIPVCSVIERKTKVLDIKSDITTEEALCVALAVVFICTTSPPNSFLPYNLEITQLDILKIQSLLERHTKDKVDADKVV